MKKKVADVDKKCQKEIDSKIKEKWQLLYIILYM